MDYAKVCVIYANLIHLKTEKNIFLPNGHVGRPALAPSSEPTCMLKRDLPCKNFISILFVQFVYLHLCV